MKNRRFTNRDTFIKKQLLDSSKKFIVNLSNHTLSKDEISLLSRGLNFCPTPTTYNQINTYRDTLLFCRRLRLKHFFRNNDHQEPDRFKKSTGWTPQVGNSASLDTFINVISHEINSHKKTKNTTSNLTPGEINALTELRNNTSIIIKPADKGGAIVILNRLDYIAEGLRQLNNTEFYRKIPKDNTKKISSGITSFLQFLKSRKLLSDDHIQFLTPKNCRTPVFYMLPKIHKANNPGRPIVSACDSPTEKLSEYLDFHLQPISQKVDSYIKDTTHFLQKLESLQGIPPNSYLVTIDVNSLYTSIPHRDGILAVKNALENRTTKQPYTWILLRLLHLVLSKTSFRFNDEFYEQISGTSMGTRCAPSYAIIFMDWLEQRFLSREYITPMVWWRYIDDIFMIWPHSREELVSFIMRLNQTHDTIKFTSEMSQSSVNFLDVQVHLDEQGNISTSLYTKPTDAHMYLHYTSFHPNPQKKAIPYSQALRIRRICSSVDSYWEATETLYKNLHNRGYPRTLVKQAIAKAATKDRLTLLKPKDDETEKNGELIPFTVTFNPRNPPINNILHRYRRIIDTASDLSHLRQYSMAVVFRRATNIKQVLVKSDLLPSNVPNGSGPCNKPCIICPHMVKTAHYTSSITKQTYKILGHYNCKTKSVVYLITCNICNTQYVGQTGNTVNERIRGHLADIRANNQFKPVARHFTAPNHSPQNLNVTVITQTTSDVNFRLRTEESFIQTLKTREPDGLNLIQ